MDINAVKNWTEIVRNLLTGVGVLMAGAWTFYIFVLGRSFAPNIQVKFALKSIINNPNDKIAIITAIVKNVGKTRVRKKQFQIAISPMRADYNKVDISQPIRIDDSLDSMVNHAKVYSLFDGHYWFEPDEEAEEDIMLLLGKISVVKVLSIFDGYKQSWTSSSILEVSMNKLEENAK